ncbi:hypothetical protein HG530_006901 [Fusarium avenaceum]|nr:hypothetical protein HG530_006901 [Fusarium avenaceum]
MTQIPSTIRGDTREWKFGEEDDVLEECALLGKKRMRGIIRRCVLAYVWKVEKRLDSMLLQMRGTANARKLKELRGSERSGGKNDVLSINCASISQLNPSCLELSVKLLQNDFVDKGLKANFNSPQGVLTSRPLTLPIRSGLAYVSTSEVISSVLIAIRECANAKLFPSNSSLLSKWEEAVRRLCTGDMNWPVLAVLLGILIIEPMFRLLEPGQLAFVTIAVIIYQ